MKQNEAMPLEPGPYDALLLDRQLCFPLYACAREVVRRYKPFLDELDLTYTQYVVMLVMWEKRNLTSRELGEKLHLDSGTLTPVLKKLEQKGLLSRGRCEADERNLMLEITSAGLSLREQALDVPRRMAQCMPLEPAEALQLYALLNKLLKAF